MSKETQTLFIRRKKGESPQHRRVRIMTAITKLLSSDELLRQELAQELALREDLLDYEQRRAVKNNNGHHTGEPEPEFEEC